MQDLDQLKKQLQQSGQAESLRTLAESPAGRQLGRMLDRQAVEAALRQGDTAALQSAVGKLLESAEGQRLSRELEKLMKERGHG